MKGRIVMAKHIRQAGCILAAASLLLASSVDAQTTTSVSTQSATAKKDASAPNTLGQKYDTKLPIEISSDNLEVLQHENKAIFKGNVIAVQGKIRLTADTMIVHYRQKADQPGQPGKPAQPAPPPPPPPAFTPGGTPSAATTASPPNEMGAISLIEVEGNVFMATPEESAKGDKGDYQVDEKLLHLFGDNVILTRDKNILRGTEMVYNLETGRSVLTSHGTQVGPNGGRVRGVFVPNQDNGKTGNAKGAKTKKNPDNTTPPTNTSSATAPPAAASVAQPAAQASGATTAAPAKSNP